LLAFCFIFLHRFIFLLLLFTVALSSGFLSFSSPFHDASPSMAFPVFRFHFVTLSLPFFHHLQAAISNGR